MKVAGKPMRTIWLDADGRSVGVIDQTQLPHRLVILRLTSLDDMAHAICTMVVRGAPLLGAAAAYGVCLALMADTSDGALDRACQTLAATRPTAVNLRWALDELDAAVRDCPREERLAAALARAQAIADEDVAICAGMGRHGLPLIEAIAARKRVVPLMFSRIAMPVGLPPSISVPRPARSMPRMTPDCRSMSMLMRRAHAIKGHR